MCPVTKVAKAFALVTAHKITPNTNFIVQCKLAVTGGH